MSEQSEKVTGYVIGAVILLAAGAVGDHYVEKHWGNGGTKAPSSPTPTISQVPADGHRLRDCPLDEPCPTTNGDVYLSDKDNSVWVLRGAEAMPVHVVTKFSQSATQPTTQAAIQQVMEKAEIARQVSRAAQNMQDEASDEASDQSSDVSSEPDY